MKSKTVTLPPALGSYVNIFRPRPPAKNPRPGQPKVYDILLAWPKEQATKGLAELRAAALEVAEAAWPSQGAEVLRKQRTPLIRDGDDLGDPTFRGTSYVHAKRQEQYGPPGVVNAQVQDVFPEDGPQEAYSGCTFRAQVTVFPFDNEGGKGVAVGLSNLQVVRKGKRLDGRQDPQEAFADFAEEPEEAEEKVAPAGRKPKREPWE